jgi:hypothetical protein
VRKIKNKGWMIMKKAVVIISYQEEKELNTFLSTNTTEAEVSAVYEDLDATDVEHLEDVINRDLISTGE